MSRFLIWSDLHTEFDTFQVPVPACRSGATPGAPAREEIDAILLPGDLATAGRHVDLLLRIWDAWRLPVLAVGGNHEPWGAESYQDFIIDEQSRIEELRNLGADIDVLRRKERVFEDFRVLGATLWTDFDLYPDRVAAARMRAHEHKADYDEIRWRDAPEKQARKLRVEDIVAEHRRDFSFLMRALARPHPQRTIVLTHHLPIEQAMSPKRRMDNDVSAAFYASNLWPIIGNFPFDFWAYGHNHEKNDVELEGRFGVSKFLSNQRGYPWEETGFDMFRIFETSCPETREAAPLVAW